MINFTAKYRSIRSRDIRDWRPYKPGIEYDNPEKWLVYINSAREKHPDFDFRIFSKRVDVVEKVLEL